MVILYPSYDINKLKGPVNSGSPFIHCSNYYYMRGMSDFSEVPSRLPAGLQ